MIIVFWMLSFKPDISLSSFILIKRFFSSSWLSAIRVISIYLRLLIFPLAILILACESSSLAFCMMYSAYKSNKQWQYTAFSYSFPNFEPVYCSTSSPNCFFLTWIQVSQETSKVVWYSCLLYNFPQIVVIHTVKAFHIVNEADAFLEFPCFMILWMLAIWSPFPLPF